MEQGIPYYNKITELFPTVEHLSLAKEDEVLKAWQGLGYYTRARNLHAAARQIVNDYNGKFPSSYDDILKLKGVGYYTAAAIASFAFNLPHAVVDGNVQRVLSRIFGIYDEVNSSSGKKKFSKLADDLLDRKNPGAYNQAIMDFGATICLPFPLCKRCCFKKECFAFVHNEIKNLPQKKKKNEPRTRWFIYFVFSESYHSENIIIEKRIENDIWKGLYQFPLLETKTLAVAKSLIDQLPEKERAAKGRWRLADVSSALPHQLSHQTIRAQFIRISFEKFPEPLPEGWIRVTRKKLKKFPFPKLLARYSEKYIH